MDGQSNARPVIIKRKKIVQGGGHHGGAWKVAYADFVTAMMAFFMLMWLLNATTENQRKGLADYFSPTIPVNRVSGGGDGAFGGDSMFTENVLPQNGTGASNPQPLNAESTTPGETGEALREAQASIENKLLAMRGESMTMERALRHIVTKITDEGLVIELFDLPQTPLFAAGTDQPEPVTGLLAEVLAEVLALTQNAVAVQGHVKSFPITLIDNPEWSLSSARAQSFRGLLEAKGLPQARFERIAGFANRKPVTAKPTAVRNNRIEVILLRKDR